MSDAWELSDRGATFTSAGLCAALAPDRPQEGCRIAAAIGTAKPTICFGRLTIADSPQGGLVAGECCPRGCELLVAYPETPHWPVRVDLRWAGTASAALPPAVVAFELAVSVHTSLLDSHPELTIRSDLPAGQFYRLRDAGDVRFTPLEPADDAVLRPADGPGCLLVRLPDGPCSYAEMTLPCDFEADTLHWPAASGDRVALRHRFFARRLEKGVILRSRVVGAFLPRDDDLRLAAGFYAALAASGPDLDV